MAARILSISYSETLLTTRQLLLQRAGFEVVSCNNLEDAIRNCERDDFDLVLIGHSLPSDQRRRILSTHNGKSRKSPVIALSVGAQECIEGATLTVDPYDPAELLTAINQILGRN